MSDALVSNYDYVIVGAGSAGCVLANRLSEAPANSVLLIEAGKDDRHLFIRMPTALSIPMNTPRFNWGYWGQPEPYLDGRRMDCARGKVLGGSSAINGMVYVRGNPADFDQWEAEGAKGWSYADCLPYFKRAEGWMGGADDYRGGSGPLSTCNGNNMSNPLYQAFIDAGREAGYGVTDDYNGYRQEGFGPMHMTVRRGERCSTDLAYLAPARRRANLTVITEAEVDRLTFAGLTVTGLRYRQKGLERSVKARKEVILSAGSVGSPTLLQRSGVGPLSVLLSAGVPVRHELPGVGENLQDHLEVYFQYRCKQPITINGYLGWLSKFRIGAQWVLTKTGLGATNHFESCGFIRSRAGLAYPDIQYHFLPAAIRYDGRAAFDGHGFQVHVGPNKPDSRGHVRISGPDSDHDPLIQFNYLSTEKDLADWRHCLRLTREILQQPALDAFRAAEIQPGIDLSDDAAVDGWVRQNVETAYHPSCSCRMGREDDDMAVVDPRCRVRGLRGLRVVDSSIFPSIPNGNLNAPTIMVAERAADLILGKEPLRQAAPVWRDPEWRSRQRERDPVRVVPVGPAPLPNRPVNTILSIAIGMTTLTSLLLVVRYRTLRIEGTAPMPLITFLAVLFTSGLDVGLLMFPMVDFGIFASEPDYAFTNPLALEFGFWGFLVWGFYFLTTFYFCVIEPRLQLFEIPAIKLVNNLTIIGTCAFTGYLFLHYLPSYIDGIPDTVRFGLVAVTVLVAVVSSTQIRFVKVLSLVSSGLFFVLIGGSFIASDMGASGLLGAAASLGDYFVQLPRFVFPINDYHAFYLFWWFAWSIMIGQFISRYVSGFTTWQLLLLLLVVPSIPIALWFSVLYWYFANDISIAGLMSWAMMGVGILFVVNSLDSLTRLYTQNIGLTAEVLGTGRYIAVNWVILFALVLAFQFTPFKIEWVGLVVIGIYTAIYSLVLLRRAALRSVPA